MMNQTDIANYFKVKYGTKIDQTRISKLYRRKENVSANFADALAEEFPGTTSKQWKQATPEELRQAFAQLKNEVA